MNIVARIKDSIASAILEVRIDATRERAFRLHCEGRRDEAQVEYRRMAELIGRRSPGQVERMERKAGVL